jgi:hypothetical protein
VEGWKSVEVDPASDSAHRLLADSYAALPRHEVARVSELLQAQLLQPLNITPSSRASPRATSEHRNYNLQIRVRYRAFRKPGLVRSDSVKGVSELGEHPLATP